jgi:hypothetical protein
MKILFYVAKRYSIPIVRPLIEYIDMSREDIEFAIYCTPICLNSIITQWPDKKVFQSITSANYFLPDYVLCPGNYVDHRIKGIKVQLFHGVGVEKASHYKIRGLFDIYCTSGPYVTRIYEQLQKKYQHFSIHETGWVKFDQILNYIDPIQTRQDKVLKTYKILYAPTFSRRLDSTSELLPYLLDLVNDQYQYELVIKLHELSSWKTLCDTLNQSGRIQFIEEEDITPYLHECDIMISDTSSVVYEFMALKKPVITYKSISHFNGTLNIHSVEELNAAIQQIIYNSESWIRRGQQALMQVNPYLDGRCSERIIQILDELSTESSKQATCSKPINLFRKAKMLYWYYFRNKYIE